MKSRASWVWRLGLVLLSLALLVSAVIIVRQHSQVHHLTLAAGSPTGEAFILCSALKPVVERHYPKIKISVVETGGTVESLKLLERGEAQLAVAQADIPAGPAAQLVAVLYDDTFQLLVRSDSKLKSFSDLAGQTIALATSGGQFQSFLRVAIHFGLDRSAFKFIGENDVSADSAFSEGKAQALFRVRALGNSSLRKLVNLGNVRFIPMEHAAAMKISHPAFEPTLIPAGAYLGKPAVPDEDLPSIAVHRTLLAAASVDDETVRAITGALVDWRQEIAREIPDQTSGVRLLLAQVHRPVMQAEIAPPLHPGALKFYDKDKPPFLLAHADYAGLLLTILVMIGSWLWQLRGWLEKKQKRIAADYSHRVLALMNDARQATSHSKLEQIRSELIGVLVAAVDDLVSNKLSEDSFHSFRSILQIGLEVVRDSSAALEVTDKHLSVQHS